MKLRSKLMMLLAGALLITISACEKNNDLVPAVSSDATAADASVSSHTKQGISVATAFDFSTFPNVSGTFNATGAVTTSGTATMDVHFNENEIRAHCEVVLTPTDGSGTITIHEECEFATGKGQWQIVSGTGAYTSWKGNGSLVMPTGTSAVLTGEIYAE
ncbi:MAG: hypothetical protein ACTHK8_09750 [Ginsengibacter sp.]